MKQKPYLLLILIILCGCNPDTQFDNGFLETGPDQKDDDNSLFGFGGGTHNGTSYSEQVLTLATNKNLAKLDKSWTPQWDNLISYWEFEEVVWNGTSNEIRDSIGNDHGTSQNGAMKTSDAKIGNGAGVYDDISSRIDIPSFSKTLANFTFHGWFKFDSSSGSWGTIIASTDFQIVVDNLKKVNARSDGSVIYVRTDDNIIQPDFWQSFTVTYDGAIIKIYLNGEEAESQSVVHTVNFSGLRIGYDGISGIGGVDTFKGEIDDISIWDTALSADEVRLIYSRQQATYSGEMKSRVMDSKMYDSSWTNIKMNTPIPFGKELPDGGGLSFSESTASYSSLALPPSPYNGLMESIEGLWHFNEAGGPTFTDSSGNSRDVVSSGTVLANNHGKLGTAVKIVGSSYIESSSFTMTDTTELTLSIWAKNNESTITAHQGLMYKTGPMFSLQARSDSSLTFEIKTDGSWHVVGNSPIFNDWNEWHHYVAVFNGSTVKLYRDAIEIGSFTETGILANTAGVLRFARTSGGSGYWNGIIDEAATWSRALNYQEIQQLYRRGVNRIKLQVRSCAIADCSDQDALTGAGWKGPGGNYFTYFSELYNNSSISSSCLIPQECHFSELIRDGNIQIGSLSSFFNQFGTDGISIENNRYFQYRAILESDDKGMACDNNTEVCMPEIQSIEIGPNRSP